MHRALAAAICLLVLGVVGSTLAAVWLLRWDLPTYDHWVAADLADRTVEHGLRWRELWAQHNEHRILVPRLLFLVDFLAGGGRGTVLLATSALVQAAHCLLLWRIVHAAGAAAPGHAWLALGLIAVLLFSAAQMFNLIEPFQVQFVLVHATATLAFAAAFRALGAGRARWWVVALAAGVVSALSMANGLLVLPLLAALAWLHRGRAAERIGLTLTVAALLLAWLWGYRTSPSGEFDPAQNLRRPWRIVAYVACWAGSPWRAPDGASQVVAGGIAGAAGLLAFFVLAGRVLRRGRAARPAHAVLAWTGLFLVGTALVTASGRSAGSLAQAQADRYATPCHVFWVVLCGLAAGHGPVLRRVALTVAAVLASLLAFQQPGHLTRCGERAEAVRHAERAVLCGVRDDEAMPASQLAGFLPPIYDHWLAMLQHRRWSVFAGADAGLVGRRLDDLFTPAPDGVALGAIERTTVLSATGWGCRVAGWAWDVAARRPPRRVLLVADDGVIVGLAGFGRQGPLMFRRGAAARPRAEFTGFAAASTSRPAFTAFAVLADGRAGRCGAAVRPELPALALERPGPPLPLLPFALLNAAPALRRDPAAEALGIAGAHATAEEHFGRIEVGPLPAGVGRVAIPVQVGPCAWGMSVHLVDLVTWLPVASLAVPPTHGGWAVWQVDLPPAKEHPALGFFAIDRGARPGQWLAVGQPVRVD